MTWIVIDVRTPAEFHARHVDGAINLSIASPGFIPAILAFPREGEYLTYCNAGHRAGQAADLMRERGFTDVTSAGIIRAALLTGRDLVTTPGFE